MFCFSFKIGASCFIFLCFRSWFRIVNNAPKRVVPNVYVGWQSSSARRVTRATQDNDWLQDSHADLPGCMGKHWQRCFPTLAEGLSQNEGMICARAQAQADFAYSVCQELSPQQEAQYIFWLLRRNHIHLANLKDDWHSTLFLFGGLRSSNYFNSP